MAEQLSNGTPGTTGDIEMKEETFTEPVSNGIPQVPSTEAIPNSQVATAGAETILPAVEHLSTIQPAPHAVRSAATPPAATARLNSIPPAPSARPEKPVPHGGPTRQYLNQNLTPHLLEGIKHLAVYEPEKPLLWLADFLRDRSKEVEG